MTLNNSQEECDYVTYTAGKKKKLIHTMLNQHGIHLYNHKVRLAETKLTKPKNNLQSAERIKALVALKRNHEINLKKADKGTTTVVMNIQDKINEGQIQLDNIEHYRPLEKPMIKETNRRVKQLISELHRGNHIDDMTQRWLCQTPSTHRTPTFYTLTKIHKPIPVGRPIISGCEGPTERLSSFVDKLLQPIAKQQVSYLKDTETFRLKYLKQKQPSWIQKYTKAKDSILNQCLMCELTSSPLKLSNTRTSLHVTTPVSKEDLLKERPLDC